MVVDSMRGDSTAPIPAEVFDSAKGAEFHAFLSAAGKLSELEAVNVSPAALRVQGFLTDFFPWVKAGVKAGEQWADTSAKATTDGTDSVVVKRVTAYRVVGKDTRAIAEGAPGLERVQLDRGRHPAHAERARPHRRLGQGHGHLLRQPRGPLPRRRLAAPAPR